MLHHLVCTLLVSHSKRTHKHAPGGGGQSAYERGGDARRKFLIKPLKETDLGVAQAFFFTPKRDHVETQTIYTF